MKPFKDFYFDRFGIPYPKTNPPGLITRITDACAAYMDALQDEIIHPADSIISGGGAGNDVKLADLIRQRETIWKMTQFYIDKRDSHGVMDMGAELQALDRTIKELEG